MDIPLPSPGTNGFVVNAMAGGANAFNQVQQGNLQNQLLGQQNQYYAPQMQAQIGLAQTQARYMPAMLSAQLLSNPMYVAILSSTPQGRMQLQSLSQQAVNGVSNPQMGGYGQGMPQQNQNGLMGSIANSPMGSLYRYVTGGNNGQQQPQAQQNALNQPIYGGNGSTANYARPSSDVTTYLQQGQNTQAQPANSQQSGNQQNFIPGIGQAAMGLVQRQFAPGESMPFTGRGTGLGAGTTYTNPNTGQQYSSDTMKQAAADQATVASVQRVTPLLQDLYQNLAPLQGVIPKTELYWQTAVNALTAKTPWATNYPMPGMAGRAITDENLSPEAIAKNYGLNATDTARDEIKKAIIPVTGETSSQYISRVTWVLHNLQLDQQQGATRLAVGQNVTQGAEAPRENGPSNGSYVPSPSQAPTPNTDLTVSVSPQSSATNAIQNSPQAQNNGIAQVNLSGASKNLARTAQFPDFSTQGKAAARAWYAKQPATVQRAYLASLGSQ